MHFLRITEDSTREDVAEAVTHLRKRQRNETDPVVASWISEDIDDLLELYATAR